MHVNFGVSLFWRNQSHITRAKALSSLAVALWNLLEFGHLWKSHTYLRIIRNGWDGEIQKLGSIWLSYKSYTYPVPTLRGKIPILGNSHLLLLYDSAFITGGQWPWVFPDPGSRIWQESIKWLPSIYNYLSQWFLTCGSNILVGSLKTIIFFLIPAIYLWIPWFHFLDRWVIVWLYLIFFTHLYLLRDIWGVFNF